MLGKRITWEDQAVSDSDTDLVTDSSVMKGVTQLQQNVNSLARYNKSLRNATELYWLRNSETLRSSLEEMAVGTVEGTTATT